MNSVKEELYPCTIDNTEQPAMVYKVDCQEERPLLVALHTWSYDYKQNGDDSVYARWCKQNKWHYIHPDFRGKNDNPKAMGSEYVVQDIADAVDYMMKECCVDKQRIYLIGVSGGGHAALLMAGRHTHLFAGISAWCGIADINQWHAENVERGGGYAPNIEAACGGNPFEDETAKDEGIKRSPITYLSPDVQSVALDINAGVNDGRLGSVPFSHSLIAFNCVANEEDRIAEEDVKRYYDEQSFPESDMENISSELYGRHSPLFVKCSNNVRVVIFEGDHELVYLPALNWLNLQRKGENAKWICEEAISLAVSSEEELSGL